MERQGKEREGGEGEGGGEVGKGEEGEGRRNRERGNGSGSDQVREEIDAPADGHSRRILSALVSNTTQACSVSIMLQRLRYQY